MKVPPFLTKLRDRLCIISRSTLLQQSGEASDLNGLKIFQAILNLPDKCGKSLKTLGNIRRSSSPSSSVKAKITSMNNFWKNTGFKKVWANLPRTTTTRLRLTSETKWSKHLSPFRNKKSCMKDVLERKKSSLTISLKCWLRSRRALWTRGCPKRSEEEEGVHIWNRESKISIP